MCKMSSFKATKADFTEQVNEQRAHHQLKIQLQNISFVWGFGREWGRGGRKSELSQKHFVL